MRGSLFSAAVVAALVGYGSTIALVLSAAAAVGASPAQTTSWVLAVCLSKAVGSAFLSWWTRVPMVLAWSTPGAALIAATTGTSMNQAVGAFVFAAVLIMLTGAIRPLGRLVAAIPDGIAAGMLAGVLLPFCLALAPATQDLPELVLPMIAVFLAVRLFNPSLAVLAALAAGLGLGLLSGHASVPELALTAPALVFVTPAFDPGVLIGLGLPLYLVTMASQNLPGFATLRAAGFDAPVRPALIVTGGLSAVWGLFGAHTVSMAAITAAICLGEDVHPDRTQRWKVGLAYAGVWLLLGLFSTPIIALLGGLPVPLVGAVVGLALLGPLMGAITAAFAVPSHRFGAIVTLTVTASGVAAFGIGAAFWGLIAGLFVQATSLWAPAKRP
jgi:benzoate membrane transport protein